MPLPSQCIECSKLKANDGHQLCRFCRIEDWLSDCDYGRVSLDNIVKQLEKKNEEKNSNK